MKSDRHQTIIFIIILLVLSMGIGYAFLTTTLSIDGTSDIDSASWDVHFENVQVQSGSVTGSQVTTPATISADGQTVSYHIKLNEPGDNYTFKIDVVNAGTLDAIIDNILFKINGEDATMAPSYLAEYIVYDGYDMVNIGDYLAAGSTKTLLVGIHYRDDVDPDDLPTSNESLTISSGLVYKQLGKKSYGYSSNVLNRGESIPNTATIYDNYQSVVNETGNAFFIRYLISENRVLDWDIGFINNSNVYYMKGKTPSYSEKMTILNDIYGSSNCMEESTRINTYYFCNGTDTSFKSFIDGDIIVSGNGNECYDGSYLYYGEARE